MTQPPSKGSVDQALKFFQEECPELHPEFMDLLKDTYNFQATGSSVSTMRSIPLRDGRRLVLIGRIVGNDSKTT